MFKTVNMEQMTIISWFTANILTLYIGFKSKLIGLTLLFGQIDITSIKNVITIIGGVSSLAFVLYTYEKWCNMRMRNKVFRQTHKNILNNKK